MAKGSSDRGPPTTTTSPPGCAPPQHDRRGSRPRRKPSSFMGALSVSWHGLWGESRVTGGPDDRQGNQAAHGSRRGGGGRADCAKADVGRRDPQSEPSLAAASTL